MNPRLPDPGAKAHRLVDHSTLGWREIKKKKKDPGEVADKHLRPFKEGITPSDKGLPLQSGGVGLPPTRSLTKPTNLLLLLLYSLYRSQKVLEP